MLIKTIASTVEVESRIAQVDQVKSPVGKTGLGTSIRSLPPSKSSAIPILAVGSRTITELREKVNGWASLLLYVESQITLALLAPLHS